MGRSAIRDREGWLPNGFALTTTKGDVDVLLQDETDTKVALSSVPLILQKGGQIPGPFIPVRLANGLTGRFAFRRSVRFAFRPLGDGLPSVDIHLAGAVLPVEREDRLLNLRVFWERPQIEVNHNEPASAVAFGAVTPAVIGTVPVEHKAFTFAAALMILAGGK